MVLKRNKNKSIKILNRLLLIILFFFIFYLIKSHKTQSFPIESFKVEYPIYITLTTLPERIISVHFKNVIDYLLKQNTEFEKIILNVPYIFKRDNKKYIIPEWIKKHPKIKVNRCEDEGPITKIYGSMDIIPDNSLIIVVDDDIIYRESLIKNLLNKWQANPNAVISYRTTSRKDNESNMYNEPNGYSGYILKKELLKNIRKLKFPDECRLIDDNYLGWCFNKLKIPVIPIGGYDFWNVAKTDEHPKWKELIVHSDRNNRIKKCMDKLK